MAKKKKTEKTTPDFSSSDLSHFRDMSGDRVKVLPGSEKLTVGEYIWNFRNQITQEEATTWLAKSRNDRVMHVLIQIGFTHRDDYVRFDREDLIWRKDPLPFGVNPTNIRHEFRKFYLFRANDDRSKHLTYEKQKELFEQLLEALHPEEASILIEFFSKEPPQLVSFPNDLLTPESVK